MQHYTTGEYITDYNQRGDVHPVLLGEGQIRWLFSLYNRGNRNRNNPLITHIHRQGRDKRSDSGYMGE
jgi:hypothetical protein